MNRSYFYSYIARQIEILALEIESNGKQNLLDLNIHAESFYRDLFNKLLDYSLTGTNNLVSNATAIDLQDDINKLVIQVSSDCSKKKIEETLSKEKLAPLAKLGYRLKFIFIGKDAPTLKGKIYKNPHNILFDSTTDILDKRSILSLIREATIEKQTNVYQLMKKEFDPVTDTSTVSSNLSELIRLLSKEDLTQISNERPTELREYNIDDKINFNDLGTIKETTIEEYNQYGGMLDRLYNSLDEYGTNRKFSIFRKLLALYEKEIQEISSSNVQKFFNIIDEIFDYSRQCDNLNYIPDEELYMCIRIIVVDAFIRCKIFKKPLGEIKT